MVEYTALQQNLAFKKHHPTRPNFRGNGETLTNTNTTFFGQMNTPASSLRKRLKCYYKLGLFSSNLKPNLTSNLVYCH